MVPRASVAALEALRAEMAEARDAFLANSKLATWCRANSGALAISKTVLREAALGYVARVVGGSVQRPPAA
jgi:hypothetical protein